MFAARAGLRANASYSGILGRRHKRNKPKQAFRCWVPFVWQALVAVIVGLVVMMAGIALCTIGYYADNKTVAPTTDLFDYSPDPPEENTLQLNLNDTMARNVTKSYLHNLTYVGPMLMGCGCFSTVIACVVVCETRDRQLKAVAIRESSKPKSAKTDVCEKIVRYVIAKYKDRKQRRQGSVVSAVTCRLIDGETEADRPGHLSRDTSIAAALKTIPSTLFAVDCDRRQPTSLAPVKISGDTKCRKIVSVMSAPCICLDSVDCEKATSTEWTVISPYHEVERFPSRHRRQPCMYHDKLFWSFEIASGRDQSPRVDTAHKDRVTSSGRVGINTVNWQTISACDGASGRKTGSRNNLAMAGDASSLMRSAIPHIAVTATDNHQLAPVKKTAVVTVHQPAVSVDDCDVIDPGVDFCSSPDNEEQAVRNWEHSDSATAAKDIAAVGLLTDCTLAGPADSCNVTSQQDNDEAVTLPSLYDVTTALCDVTTTSCGANRTGSVDNHIYII